LQVFLAFDTKGMIADFYYQRLTGRDAAALRAPEFAAQFRGLSMTDFASYNPVKRDGIPGAIKPEKGDDFFSTLRAVKKNLILMEFFIFNAGEKAQ
jgi:hypothetical protein